MRVRETQWNRRAFVQTVAGGMTALAARTATAADTAMKKRNIKLGFDNFSVRNLGMKAEALLDYAATLGVDVVLFSDLDVYTSHEPDYLKSIKEKADRLGLEIQAGTGSICPSSSAFNNRFGNAEEHLALVIRVAQAIGSPVARCYMGTSRDRQGEGLAKHIENTINLCKAFRSRAQDAQVKIAIENHAGDMQSWELVELIEAAGKDFVGATLDSGNAAWTLEDPQTNLEVLGPYAATTGMRDSAVWEAENSINVEWVNHGDGSVDWPAYLDTFEKLCPNVPFILEVITAIGVRNYPFLEKDFWKTYGDIKASYFAGLLRMAKKGKPFTQPDGRPTGDRSDDLTRRQQKYDLERSLRFCKEELGLGLRA